jgi:hypothetical protein
VLTEEEKFVIHKEGTIFRLSGGEGGFVRMTKSGLFCDLRSFGI